MFLVVLVCEDFKNILLLCTQVLFDIYIYFYCNQKHASFHSNNMDIINRVIILPIVIYKKTKEIHLKEKNK